MAGKPLLSQVYTTEDGLKGRNFRVREVGFGTIEESADTEGMVWVRFSDLGNTAIEGLRYTFASEVIDDAVEAAELIDTSIRFVNFASAAKGQV